MGLGLRGHVVWEYWVAAYGPGYTSYYVAEHVVLPCRKSKVFIVDLKSHIRWLGGKPTVVEGWRGFLIKLLRVSPATILMCLNQVCTHYTHSTHMWRQQGNDRRKFNERRNSSSVGIKRTVTSPLSPRSKPQGFHLGTINKLLFEWHETMLLSSSILPDFFT